MNILWSWSHRVFQKKKHKNASVRVLTTFFGPNRISSIFRSFVVLFSPLNGRCPIVLESFTKVSLDLTTILLARFYGDFTSSSGFAKRSYVCLPHTFFDLLSWFTNCRTTYQLWLMRTSLIWFGKFSFVLSSHCTIPVRTTKLYRQRLLLSIETQAITPHVHSQSALKHNPTHSLNR